MKSIGKEITVRQKLNILKTFYQLCGKNNTGKIDKRKSVFYEIFH